MVQQRSDKYQTSDEFKSDKLFDFSRRITNEKSFEDGFTAGFNGHSNLFTSQLNPISWTFSLDRYQSDMLERQLMMD